MRGASLVCRVAGRNVVKEEIMKYRKSKARLECRQAEYDRLIAREPGLKQSHRRPGSMKK